MNAVRIAVVVLLGVSGCAGYATYSPQIDEALRHKDYSAALEVVEHISRDNAELLYCYEKGLILRAQGDFTASNASLQRAEETLEKLYTRSVTREVASLVVSETLNQYRGDAFEAVLVNYYKLLNYLALGDVDGAMVECRRLNGKLQMLRDGGESYFVDDPFLQYLTALVYEMGGEPGDAEVSYRTASRRYEELAASFAPPSPWMHCDAAANARQQGDAAAAAEYDSLCDCPALVPGAGRLTVLLECGRVARKLESDVVLPILENDDLSDQERCAHELAARRGVVYQHPPKVKYWLRVSLPVLERRPPGVGYAVVRAIPADGACAEPADARAIVVESVDAQAAAAFHEKESEVLIRAVIRGLGKYLATQAVSSKDEGLGAIVNLIGAATETADTRSWTTLPEAILMARLDLPAGRYRVEATVMNAEGKRAGRVTLGEVDVAAGRPSILSARSR